MSLSIGPLLAELAASNDGSPVTRLFPFVLLAFAIFAVVAIILGLKRLGKGSQVDDGPEPPERK